jgi:DNA-binding SARP family transcriptional activator/tetratricopeptide (TPR) repeat protein
MKQKPRTRSSEPTAIAIELLGGFRVRVDGKEIGADGWPTRRSAQLVQLLSVAERHRVLRDQVIERLWPELDPQAGAANLRKAAHHARRALRDPDAIVLQGGHVALFPTHSVSTDIARFEQLAAEALARRDLPACAQAALLYRGELLPDAPYDEFLEPLRTRLRNRYVELLRVGGQWERLIEIDATDEMAYRELMRRALAAGSSAAAIRWYGRLRATLERELGVAPGRETQRLYDECIAGLRVSEPAFVGRQMELAQVTALLRTPANRRAGGLVVRGPAGIGKSAFCRQLKNLARAEAWAFVAVDATQASRPYAAITAAVDSMILGDRTLLDPIGGPARAVLATLTPVAAPAPAPQGPLSRHQVIGAFRRLLHAAGGTNTVMVLVDDAHLIDEASVDVLIHAAANGHPIFVVLAFRPTSAPDYLDRSVARLARAGRFVAIEMGPLEREEAVNLVSQATTQALDAALVERILQLAEGNPFVTLELARASSPGSELRLPVSVGDAIAKRLCDVAPATLALLKRLALASDEFDTTAVSALTTVAEEQAFALLDVALSAGVLVVSGDRYRFRHELVRQALVDQIPPHHKRAIHRDAARRLAELNAAAAAIGRHWLAGGRPDEAVPWLVAAAREANRLGAFADALRYLEPVIAHAANHADALCLKAEALDALGDTRSLTAYAAAAAAVGESASHDLRAKRALAQLKMGDPKGALQALEGVMPRTIDGRLAEALTLSGAAALGFADPALGTQKAAESRRLSLQAEDTAAIVVASWAQAAAAHARGELHGSVWADLRETQNLPHLATRVFDGQLCITQRFLYGARPYAEVIAFADALAAEARRLGAGRGHAFAVTLRGEAELLSGDLDGAERDLATGARLHRAMSGATGEALALQRRAEAALYRGHQDIAAALLDEALDIARQSDIGFHLLDRIYGTRMELARDPESALAALEDAEDAVRGPLETCPGCRITFAVPAAIAATRALRLDLAAKYEQAAEYLARVVMRLPAWDAALAEVRAHIARASSDEERAMAHFAAAAEHFRRAGQPLDAARCERALTVHDG